MANTAKFLREAEGFYGGAAVYKLTPPLMTGAGRVHYVVTSAVDLPKHPGSNRGSETMVFACKDKDGNMIDFLDLAMVPYKSHEAALAQLGYDLA